MKFSTNFVYFQLNANKTRTFANNSNMGHTAHFLVVLSACLLVFCEARYFPDLRDFAEKSSIKASSTCGETETNYCDAKTLNRPSCTEKVCKYACCLTCSDALPNARNLAAGGKMDIYDGQPRPGTSQNSLGFNGQRGSYIEVRRLPPVDHKTKGFTICVWVNQTSGNQGYVIVEIVLTDYGIVKFINYN